MMGWWARRRHQRRMLDAMTPLELVLYARFLAEPSGSQALWDALPLWIRVALCAECGWLDAVWEVDPELGRTLDERLLGRPPAASNAPAT
jgi:hypothetical protein